MRLARWLILLSVALSANLSSTRQTVVYDSFGPSLTYNTGTAWGVSGASVSGGYRVVTYDMHDLIAVSPYALPVSIPDGGDTQVSAAAPASAREALDMVRAGLGYLAAADPTAMSAEAQAQCLLALEQADAVGTAARAWILAAFEAYDVQRPCHVKIDEMD